MISVQYVLGFALQQYESAIGTHIAPPSWASFSLALIQPL